MQRRSLIAASTLAVVAFPALASTARPPRGRLAPIPPAYQVAGTRNGVPPLILYGVALQESMLLFGPHSLPYPWTLCVRGEPRRFDAYDKAVKNLIQTVRSGVTNVDCGLVQVNWHWHYQRLQNAWYALDPYRNLMVGATLLREHLQTTGNWFDAVGRYHHPTDTKRAQSYASSVFARLPRVPQEGTS